LSPASCRRCTDRSSGACIRCHGDVTSRRRRTITCHFSASPHRATLLQTKLTLASKRLLDDHGPRSCDSTSDRDGDHPAKVNVLICLRKGGAPTGIEFEGQESSLSLAKRVGRTREHNRSFLRGGLGSSSLHRHGTDQFNRASTRGRATGKGDCDFGAFSYEGR
jgi:hypothetical protein